jgi:GxxExxY protein
MMINRGGAETRRELVHSGLTDRIIGAGIEVHRELGAGLLESAYRDCFCHELNLRGLKFQKEVSLPVNYKGTKLDCGYRIDILVEGLVIVELKCVERIQRIHEAQLLTYLRLAKIEVGLLFNFHCEVLTRGGVVRKVLQPEVLRASASPR